MGIKNQNNLQKNQKYIVDIVDYGANGEGVAKIDGIPVFVPFSIVGEQVEVVIIFVKKDFAIGKLLSVVKTSEHRVEPRCAYYGKCGGCQLQHMDYGEQLNYKTNFVKNSLKKYAGYTGDVKKCIVSAKEYLYRNKFSFPVGKIGKKIIVGMYRPLSHNLVEIENCSIQEDCRDIIDCFLKYANECDVDAKHLVARTNGDEILVAVVSAKKLQKLQNFAQYLQQKYKKVHILNNINTKNNNVILGDKDIIVCGDGQICYNEFGVVYDINIHSFMQVNNDIKRQLYNKVLAEIDSDNVVIDAYSGAGLLSAIMAKKCKSVYGIEIIKEAVDSAEKLKKENAIDNLENICGDCAVILPNLVEKVKTDTIVLDPPRKGCDKKVVDAILSVLPDKIVYISCNPATLARDLKMFMDKYEICLVQPFDMFPQTANVETLVILKLK